MAIKIEWQEPTDSNITLVRIDRSAAKFGTYTTLTASLDAGAVGSWTTSYIDTTGTTDHWYKIKFYDGTNSVWSEFSEPITGREEIRLCSVVDVKKVLDTTGRWSDTQVFDAIIEVEELMYAECGQPIASIWSEIGKINNTNQELYYVGERDIYKVDRIFYGTTTKQEIFLDDGYQVHEGNGMVKLLTTGTGAITLNIDCDLEIEYVPKIFHKMAIYRTAKQLLEEIDAVSGGTGSKELEVIEKKLGRIEQLVNNRVGMQISSDLTYYDSIYAVNRKHIVQDHDRNRYISSTGDSGW